MNRNLAQTVLCLLSSFAYAQDSGDNNSCDRVCVAISSVVAGGTQFLTLAAAVTEQGNLIDRSHSYICCACPCTCQLRRCLVER